MIPPNKKNLGLIAVCAGLCAFAAAVHAEEKASITLNPTALVRAYELIGEGRVILDGKGAWSAHRPSRAAENNFIRLHGFSQYEKWHLGIDSRYGEKSKVHYKFPFGDFSAVHRCGLLAVKARAHKYGYSDIESAADQLLWEIEINLPKR